MVSDFLEPDPRSESSGRGKKTAASFDNGIVDRTKAVPKAAGGGKTESALQVDCWHKNYRGVLCVAKDKKAVIFRSTNNFLGLTFDQNRLVIPWSSMTGSGMEESAVKAIYITLTDVNGNKKKEVKHVFYSLDIDQGTVLDALRFCQRRSSGECDDEAMLKAYTPEENADSDSRLVSHDTPKDDTTTSDVGRRVASFRRRLTEPLPSTPPRNKDASEEDYLAACAVAAMSDFRSMSKVIRSRKAKLLDADNLEVDLTPPTSPKVADHHISEDLQSWLKLRDSNEPSFKEELVKDLQLSCNLTQFYDTFLKDGARHSMADFQRDIAGDSDIETSVWTGADDGVSKTRTIQYVHPVHAPMAPPSAGATKRQRCQMFGEHGLCVDTRTVVDDVPMTDCFVVDDRLLIEPRPEGGTLLSVKFEVRFVKSTMFRGIIESTTRSEFLKFWKGFAENIVELLDTDRSEKSKEAKEIVASRAAPVSTKVEPVATLMRPTLMHLLLLSIAAVFVTNLLLMSQVASLRKSILILEKRLADMADVGHAMANRIDRVVPSLAEEN